MPETPSTEVTSTVVTDGGTDGGTQTHEGFVPQADMEREQARARSFQSEADRLKAELAVALAKNGKPEPTTTELPTGFDPEAFRRSLLADFSSAATMAQAVGSLKERFPHADPTIYDRASEYGNADALRLAVEDSHNRVASTIETESAAIEARLRAEMEEKYGNGATTVVGSTAVAGDPTIAQINAMSLAETDAFEKANPGVIERVLRSAN